MNLFVALAARAAELLAERPEFGAWIHELHHSAKRDAPSGTAIAIRGAMRARRLRAADRRGVDARGVDSRHAYRRVRRPAETITLTHTARDRTGFARGALAAAEWVNGRRGWFSMRDVLGL